MDEQYDPSAIEPKWQARWERDGSFVAGKHVGAAKKYVLEMFPYPSGALHMGHVRNYLIGDVIARYARMRGFDVLHPMGWDALGLPAENAAIKDREHPATRTAHNISSFRAEMKRIGFSYDWSRELATSDPEYYRWNQWFFLKFRERGLVYRRRAAVNFCPGCNTVIANEQVKDGRCERSGDEVEIRRMPEWAFRITSYSERLLENLNTLTEWPSAVLKKQRAWIGKSEGAELDFAVSGASAVLRVFTTRADTVFGVVAIVVAPDHPLIAELCSPDAIPAVQKFAADQARKAAARRRDTELDKEAIATGGHAIHPFTRECVPIWTANFVVSDYGTGAVMCVPAHDERDREFATKYGLPIVHVVDAAEPTADGTLHDSGPYTAMASAEARAAIANAARAGGFGGPAVTYRQRDWGISRQRYWGTPIPIFYCDHCDPAGEGIAVPYDQLPVRLPEIEVDKVLTGRGEPPLAKVPIFVATTCPQCGGPARRDVETMDTFVDSAWYFARFLDPHNDREPFARSLADAWLPVDVYIGGPEHSTMHLLYFRFWTMVMQELGLVEVAEPVRRMITQGIVNGPDGRKMSKRWGNVVSPAAMVEAYGADATRTFVMFAGPADEDIDWSDTGVEGSARFLARVWRLARRYASARADAPRTPATIPILRAAHQTLRRVTEDLERQSFNTAIARIHELVNALTPLEPHSEEERVALTDAVRILAACVSPFAPHIAEEIAEACGATSTLQESSWPDSDATLCVEERITYAIQIDGRLRGQVDVDAGADEPTVRAAAVTAVQPYLADKTVTKFVFVPRRQLVNFVTR